MNVKVDEVKKAEVVNTNSQLNSVTGLGPKTIATLTENGITGIDELRAIDKDKLYNIIKNPIARKQVEDFLALTF